MGQIYYKTKIFIFFNLILIYKDELKFLKTFQYNISKNKVDKYICFNLSEYEV